MLALEQYERDCCPDCHVHKSVTEDPENHVLVPDEARCPICAGLAVQHRVKDAEDARKVKALGPDPDPRKPRPDDGRRLFLRPATPAELIERKNRLDQRRRREG